MYERKWPEANSSCEHYAWDKGQHEAEGSQGVSQDTQGLTEDSEEQVPQLP